LEQAWETCENSDWMLWVLARTDLDLTDPLCDMAKRVLHLVPEDIKLVCSNAINSAKRRASQDELKAAYISTFNTANAAAFAAAYSAAYSAAYVAAYVASRTIASRTTADYAADYAADAALYAVRIAADAAYVVFSSSCAYNDFDASFKEKKKQCDILRKYFTIDQVREAFNKLVA
jgi:hypothetical protein